MTCVVLGGSRQITHLNEDIKQRVDRIVRQQFSIVLGDANGADKAFQKYLSDLGYKNVEVFCSGSFCRNNLGQWPCRNVSTKARAGTFEFYAAKDQAMADAATVGFMLWNGRSVGSVINVWRLMRSRKTSLVYLLPERRFIEVRGDDDWRALLTQTDAETRRAVERKIESETKGATGKELPLFGPDLHSMGLV
jgi:hypothetical protein